MTLPDLGKLCEEFGYCITYNDRYSESYINVLKDIALEMGYIFDTSGANYTVSNGKDRTTFAYRSVEDVYHHLKSKRDKSLQDKESMLAEHEPTLEEVFDLADELGQNVWVSRAQGNIPRRYSVNKFGECGGTLPWTSSLKEVYDFLKGMKPTPKEEIQEVREELKSLLSRVDEIHKRIL